MKLNRRSCEKALKLYNEGTYRGALNVELDARGYELFRCVNFRDSASVLNCVLFAGRDYGGAQLRFLPEDGYKGESRRIARRVQRRSEIFERAIRGSAPLIQQPPDRAMVAQLLEAFEASKRWPVWASKFLHFAAPNVFPILDSRAQSFFDVPRSSNHATKYFGLITTVRETLIRNSELLASLMEADAHRPPSLLKLIDKVAYSAGNSSSCGS